MTHFIEELSASLAQGLGALHRQAVSKLQSAEVPTVPNERLLNSATANRAFILTEAFPIIKLMHRRVCWGGSPD